MKLEADSIRRTLFPKSEIDDFQLKADLLVKKLSYSHLELLTRIDKNEKRSFYEVEVMREDDNPTVGILLVTDKNQALVEYATAGMDNQLFISKYLLELPKKEELAAFIKAEIERLK